MNILKERYEKTIEKRKEIIEEMRLLEENDIVKKYFELKKQDECLYEDQLALFKEIKNEEYESCNHILVYSNNGCKHHTYESCGCIKCGLDNSVLEYGREYLSFEQTIMYDYLAKKYLKGRRTQIECDLDLAQAIYSKIRQAYPDIDDETIIKYFEVALDDIRNIEVSDERKTNRAKRLSLDPKFQNWN